MDINTQLNLYGQEAMIKPDTGYCPSGDQAFALGFNNTPKCLTDTFTPVESDNHYLVNVRDLTPEQRDIYFSYCDSSSVGATINLYPSGEVSCGYFSPVRPSLKSKGAAKGSRYTETLVDSAKKTIRRVGRNVTTPFKTFVTFTFDPKKAELSADGTVCHDYANRQLKRTLNTISKKYDRLATAQDNPDRRFQYICVGEIQPETGNLHFHLVTNQYFRIGWLCDIWGQSSNSVDVKKLKGDSIRCIRYLLKYVTKDQKNNPHGNRIKGNRYSISQGLRDESKPRTVRCFGAGMRGVVRTYVDAQKNTLLQGKGFLCDYGFWIPPASRSVDGLKRINQVDFLFNLAGELARSGDDSLLFHLLNEGYGDE